MNEKLKLFCDEYLKDFNGTRSYIAVWGDKVSYNTAGTESSKHLKNPKVQEYLAKRIQDRTKRLEIEQDDVLRALWNMFNVNVTDVVSTQGNYTVNVADVSKLPDEIKSAIKSIKPTRSGIDVEFYDKLEVARLLGKHLGLFNDKVEISGDSNKPVIITGSDNLED